MMMYKFRLMNKRLSDDDNFGGYPMCEKEIVGLLSHWLLMRLGAYIYANRKTLVFELALGLKEICDTCEFLSGPRRAQQK